MCIYKSFLIIIISFFLIFNLNSCKIYYHKDKSPIGAKKDTREKKEKRSKRKYFTYGLKAKEARQRGDAYIVKKGDTLYSISLEYEINYLDIAKWNKISKPYKIKVGDSILIKPSVERKKIVYFKKDIEEKNLKWTWPHRGRILKDFNLSEIGKKGIDIEGSEGDSIISASDGTVVYAGDGIKGYGNLIIIKHSNSLLSAYAHNKELLVNEGSRIKKGDRIAILGSTDAQRPMLHFQLRKNGISIDPKSLLPKT
jgi:murein DD-endopeptidase MepM/ murein hydrolase activator NlpD